MQNGSARVHAMAAHVHALREDCVIYKNYCAFTLT